MQRYASSFERGTVIRARNDAPLTDDQLRAGCPSIFAEHAHESRSDRYVQIPTHKIVTALRRFDYQPFAAAQAATRDDSKRGYTKHMIRFRHRSIETKGDSAFEIILLNDHAGGMSYKMIPGLFRFICFNGLLAGETFAEHKARHSGDAIEKVIEGCGNVLQLAPKVIEARDRMRATRYTHASGATRWQSWSSKPHTSSSSACRGSTRKPVTSAWTKPK